SQGDNPGRTTLEFLQLARDSRRRFKRGSRIEVPKYRPGQPGELFLLFGKGNDTLQWETPEEITETSYQYVAQSPSREVQATKRLRYYLRFLEYSDAFIANDAFAEFSKAPYAEVKKLASDLPRNRLRSWLFDGQVRPIRRGLYGLMLGLCGQEQDRQKMRAMIISESTEYRLGIDGVMGGYLLLAGAAGLDVIDTHQLRNREAAFSETFAAMQALRFMWSYGNQRISKDRLRQSLRILLDRPKLAEIVITDLARWQDWSIQTQLMTMFTDQRFQDKFTRRAIAAFLLVSVESDSDAKPPMAHVQRGRKYLTQIQATAPDVLRAAKRLVALQQP
ncbi:MAG: hypothetical protein ABGZ17_00625, partial [Planctomycetaceae bacterium]